VVSEPLGAQPVPECGADGWSISACFVGLSSVIGSVKGTAQHSNPGTAVAHMLVDSGAEVRVCPPNFASEWPILPATRPLRLRAVNGQELAHLGVRKVPVILADVSGVTHKAVICFQVAPMSRPVLSAVRLASCGFCVQFEQDSAHLRGPDGAIFDLARSGQVYLLPARLAGTKRGTTLLPKSCLKQASSIASQTRPREERVGKEGARTVVSAAVPGVVGILPISEGGSSASGVVRGARPDEGSLGPEPQDPQPPPPQPHYKRTRRQVRGTLVVSPTDWRAHRARTEPQLPEGPEAETAAPGGELPDLSDELPLNILVPDVLPTPEPPSKGKAGDHLLTHVPYARWCRHCVEGGGKDDEHLRRQYLSEQQLTIPRLADSLLLESEGGGWL
jgi:hypothetical protein